MGEVSLDDNFSPAHTYKILQKDQKYDELFFLDNFDVLIDPNGNAKSAYMIYSAHFHRRELSQTTLCLSHMFSM